MEFIMAFREKREELRELANGGHSAMRELHKRLGHSASLRGSVDSKSKYQVVNELLLKEFGGLIQKYLPGEDSYLMPNLHDTWTRSLYNGMDEGTLFEVINKEAFTLCKPKLFKKVNKYLPNASKDVLIALLIKGVTKENVESAVADAKQAGAQSRQKKSKGVSTASRVSPAVVVSKRRLLSKSFYELVQDVNECKARSV